VKLEVLHVPSCPNLAPLLEHLREVTDLPITTIDVNTDQDAAACGMTGSPTLLIDGIDPFAAPGLRAGVACRIYRDRDGRMTPVPSTTQLRAVLRAGQPHGCGAPDGE
jgi:hypothetical protein